MSNYEPIDAMFMLNDQIQLWPIINQRYKDFCFTDDISDKERIEEYNYIIDQLSKFVFKNQDSIQSCNNNLMDMLEAAKNLLPKDRQKATTRKELVYRSLRDEWIMQLISVIVALIEEVEGAEE